MHKGQWIGLGLAGLLVAGCNKAAELSNATVPDNGASANEAAGLDTGGEAAPVAVAPVPAPAADVAPADAAPLQQAAEASSQIESGADVERIPYDGGWAWRRGGRIIRTASRDGRVSYFRPGDSNPYLVQEAGRVFAYANGRVERSYDTRGRPAQPDAKQQDQAQRLARQSAQEHDQAKQVAARQPQRVQPVRPQPPAAHAPGNHAAPEHGKHPTAAASAPKPGAADHGPQPDRKKHDDQHRDRNGGGES